MVIRLVEDGEKGNVATETENYSIRGETTREGWNGEGEQQGCETTAHKISNIYMGDIMEGQDQENHLPFTIK